MIKGTRADFNKLDTDIKLDVLTDFCTYNKTHLEKWKNGKIDVTPDFCLSSNNYEKPELTMEFHKSDFTEEEIAMAYWLKYGEKFDRKKHEASIAEFYAF